MSAGDREPAASTYEHLRQLSKRLTRGCRAGDAAALDRIRAQLPRLAALDPTTVAACVKLADVQHALAREAGLTDWAALKAFVQGQEPMAAQVARFLHALPSGDLDTMSRVLQDFPQVAFTSLHAACAACDEAAVDSWLTNDPAAATAPIRGSDWTPLMCLAASPLFALDRVHRGASVAIAVRLLARGADPNGATAPPSGGEGLLTVLYRASERGNAGLVRLLLEHGARPDDGESVYHAAERGHLEVLELLRAHGAELSATHRPWDNTVLYYLAGYRDGHPLADSARAGMRWLLEHGADPDVPSHDVLETPLHRVAARGDGAALARLLLDHGADPRARRADGRTPYELAMRVGDLGLVELLRARGGGAERLLPIDQVLHACAIGDGARARRLLTDSPGLHHELLTNEPHALHAAVEAGAVGAVEVLVSLGVDPAREGPWGGTALHWASWRGRVEGVRALLAAGAPLDLRDRTYGSSPLAWAAHGSAHCREAGADYLEVIDLLLAAKPDRASSLNRWGEPPENLASEAIADHLRARGFAPEV